MSSNIRVIKICQHCGNDFIAQTTVTKYCNHKCASRAYKERKRNAKIEGAEKQTLKIKTHSIEVLNTKEFLTVREVAKLLSCSVRTVYYQIESGRINAINLGDRLTRVKRSEIDRLFDRPNEM